jgi:hypothetical protein
MNRAQPIDPNPELTGPPTCQKDATMARIKYRPRTKQPARRVRTIQGTAEQALTPAELYNRRFERWGYYPDRKDRPTIRGI